MKLRRAFTVMDIGEEIQKNDVALFRRPAENGRGVDMLHRVLKRFPDGRFRIVGDNCIC